MEFLRKMGQIGGGYASSGATVAKWTINEPASDDVEQSIQEQGPVTMSDLAWKNEDGFGPRPLPRKGETAETPRSHSLDLWPYGVIRLAV
jgi:hypothetical protein